MKKYRKVKIENMSRQGDLLMRRVESLPTQATPVQDNILAHGEATGHAHRIAFDPNVAVKALNAAISFQTTEDAVARLTHEEHKAHTFKGKFEVIKQQEYSPEGWRQVYD